jgi:tetratricopeptide (TPR) repeat protein
MVIRREAAVCAIIAMAVAGAFAQNEIKYDPEKGIMIVDKKHPEKKDTSATPMFSIDKSGKKAKEKTFSTQSSMPMLSSPDSTDLHVGRKKDPSTLYFMSGLEYFKNADYSHALQNFTYADSIDPKPVFRLWIGKTRRQLGEGEKMLPLMEEIVKKYPTSDVADDALFEVACYYQGADDYDAASRLYTQLAEQYPFGESYSTGEKFGEIARECRKKMNAELSNMLAIAGYANEELSAAISGFQRDHRLQQTGEADPKTVGAIKKASQKLLDRDQENAEKTATTERYAKWAVLAGGAALLNLFLAIGLFFGIRAKQRYLRELTKTVADFTMVKS